MSIRAPGTNKQPESRPDIRMQPTSSQKSSKTACQPGGIHISRALAAMGPVIRRCARSITASRRGGAPTSSIRCGQCLCGRCYGCLPAYGQESRVGAV